jgi:glycerol uptake facilitator-like aquaporin
MTAATARKLLAEGLGTALLLAIVIGSGIMAERLSGGNAAIALLANTLATVGGLVVLIELLGPVSGAHFNPAVSLAMAVGGRLAWRLAAAYVALQLLGAVLGAWLAHAMFDQPLLQFSTHGRGGTGQWIAEGVATCGLQLAILRAPADRAAAIVAAWIGAAYWFTASTSFANPAAVLGRMLSDSFAGIAPSSAPGFVVAELAGACVALGLHRLLASAPPGAGARAGFLETRARRVARRRLVAEDVAAGALAARRPEDAAMIRGDARSGDLFAR